MAEGVLGVGLPADYRAWLALHDGGPAALFRDEVLDIASALDSLRMHEDVLAGDDMGGRASPGVRPRWWHRGWLPITSDGSGNHLCLDLDPAPGGTFGQVIRFWHDGDERTLEAPSFAAWLALCAQRLETGEWVAVDDGTDWASVMSRASLRGSLVTAQILGESDPEYLARIANEKRENPGWVVMEVLRTLVKYRLIDIAGEPWMFTIVASALSLTTPDTMYVALAANPAVTRLAVDAVALAAIADAVPDVSALLGDPPSRQGAATSAI